VQPVVSVVVPVFNGMPYLPALTQSLLAQTYDNLELIFVEGGGSDSSTEYLASLGDSRIRLIQMPQGTTAAENWTAASLAASGEFTKLICQDDLLHPNAIEKQVADLRDHPTAVMSIAQRDIVDAQGRRLYSRRGLAGLSPGLNRGNRAIRECYLRGTNVIGEPLAVLFRTEILKDSLPWVDENPLMLDLSMYAKVAPKGDVIARMESIGAFRVSGTSWSTQLARKQREQTKSWQESYAQSSEMPPSANERRQAALGRSFQVSLRRIAYAVLRVRGSLNSASTHERA
jgi:glycosyltransferase involved in cell wall biosynthesis